MASSRPARDSLTALFLGRPRAFCAPEAARSDRGSSAASRGSASACSPFTGLFLALRIKAGRSVSTQVVLWISVSLALRSSISESMVSM